MAEKAMLTNNTLTVSAHKQGKVHKGKAFGHKKETNSFVKAGSSGGGKGGPIKK